MRRENERGRGGAVFMDVVAALVVLALVLGSVAQAAVWALLERNRQAARLEALEQAANLLEAASVVPFDELTPRWADAQALQMPAGSRLSGATCTVAVADEPERAGCKRVSVEIRPAPGERLVRLEAVFAARSGGKPGGKP